MRRPLVYSVILHAAVIAIVGLGLPALSPKPVPPEETIVVELVPLAETANPPPAQRPAPIPERARPTTPAPMREQPEPVPPSPRAALRPEPPPPPRQPLTPKPEPKMEPKPEPKPEPKAERQEPKVQPPRPEPAKPEPPKPPVAKSEPKPEPPKPAPEKAAAKPEPPKPAPAKPQPKTLARAEPEDEPKAEPRPPAKPKPPEPKEEPKAQAKPEAKAAAAKPEPAKASTEHKAEPKSADVPAKAAAPKAESKPEPADDFASVLKTVGELKQTGRTESKQSAPPARKAETPGDPAFGSQMAQALRSAGPTGNKPSLPVTAREIDAVRRQIERCWNVPSGAKEAGEVVVSIRVEMNADGTPRTAVIDSSSRGQSNPYFQAAADSARRAVLNPRCHPFKLPADKYDRWRTMTLVFNPRDVAGT